MDKKIDKKLKVGISGYGVVGKRRRVFIDKNPCFRTIAVCDCTFEKDGVFDDGVQYFSNYKDLLKLDLDVLFVCVPNYLAPEITMAGMERGMHVFCEKPPGRTVEDIRKVVAVEKENSSLKLKYGFNHRYHDSVREALRIIKTEELGSVLNVRGVYGKSKIIPFSGGWRAERKYSGGGILLDQGIHMVDLMQLFCGDFKEVKSFVSNDYWGHDVEDNAYAIMRDEYGRIAMLHSTATQWRHRFSLEISLTNGTLELQGILSGSKSYGQEQLIITRRSEANIGAQTEEVINYLNDSSWKDEINEFADSITDNKEIVFGTSKDALRTMELVYRIYYADSEWRDKYKIPDPDRQGGEV